MTAKRLGSDVGWQKDCLFRRILLVSFALLVVLFVTVSCVSAKRGRNGGWSQRLTLKCNEYGVECVVAFLRTELSGLLTTNRVDKHSILSRTAGALILGEACIGDRVVINDNWDLDNRNSRPVVIDVANAPIETIVTMVCQQTHYVFEISNGSILVAPNLGKPRVLISGGGRATVHDLKELVVASEFHRASLVDIMEYFEKSVAKCSKRIAFHGEDIGKVVFNLTGFDGNKSSVYDVLHILTRIAPIECHIRDSEVVITHIGGARGHPLKSDSVEKPPVFRRR